MSSLIGRSLNDFPVPISPLTQAVVNHPLYFLLIPIPWLIYASVLGKRRELNPNAVFVFTGTLALAAAILIGATMIGWLLPCLPVARAI